MQEVKFNFEDLIVYQKSLDFVDLVYNTCDEFPKMEAYILVSQYIRAANSIALNISEGAGASDAQFNRYLQLALRFYSRMCSLFNNSYKKKIHL
jgi:hypothetical protein